MIIVVLLVLLYLFFASAIIWATFDIIKDQTFLMAAYNLISTALVVTFPFWIGPTIKACYGILKKLIKQIVINKNATTIKPPTTKQKNANPQSSAKIQIEPLLPLINSEKILQHENLENKEIQEDVRYDNLHIPSVVANTQSLFVTYGGVNAALLDIDLMEGHAFECWCADALKGIGFYDIEITPSTGDHGVDILAKKDGIKYAVQCKRYNSDLGNKPIQEVHAGKAMYHCHVGVVITNQYFTANAKTLADATGTLLWDRDWIKDYLEKKLDAPIQSVPKTMPVHNTTVGCEDEDPMFNDAVDVVLETGQASVSMIQRRLKLGYARAARLIDSMEERGIVGPFMGSKPRAILITKEQWRIRRDK